MSIHGVGLSRVSFIIVCLVRKGKFQTQTAFMTGANRGATGRPTCSGKVPPSPPDSCPNSSTGSDLIALPVFYLQKGAGAFKARRKKKGDTSDEFAV